MHKSAITFLNTLIIGALLFQTEVNQAQANSGLGPTGIGISLLPDKPIAWSLANGYQVPKDQLLDAEKLSKNYSDWYMYNKYWQILFLPEPNFDEGALDSFDYESQFKYEMRGFLKDFLPEEYFGPYVDLAQYETEEERIQKAAEWWERVKNEDRKPDEELDVHSIREIERRITFLSESETYAQVDILTSIHLDALNGKNISATNNTVNEAKTTADGAKTLAETANNTSNEAKMYAQNLGKRVESLEGRVDGLEQRISTLDEEYKKGMAINSALTGLFQPYSVGKFNTSVALGGYDSKTAVAAGLGYRANENLAFKGGLATSLGSGSSKVGYNVGMNYEW